MDVAFFVRKRARAGTQKLAWKFAVNDVFDVEFVQTTSVESESDKRQSTSSTSMTMKMDWKVNEVAPNGNAKMTQAIPQSG